MKHKEMLDKNLKDGKLKYSSGGKEYFIDVNYKGEGNKVQILYAGKFWTLDELRKEFKRFKKYDVHFIPKREKQPKKDIFGDECDDDDDDCEEEED